MNPKSIKRLRILDCEISQVNMDQALRAVVAAIDTRRGGYVCFANVHTVVTARSDNRLRASLNNSLLSVPDGKPLYLASKMKGSPDVGHVPGPDFLPYCLATSPHLRHFFLGSTPETLESLSANLCMKFPGTKIIDCYSPPFRPLTASESQSLIERIRMARPDVVWVGLGAPKQEYWMAENWQALSPAVLMGVGAAFDFHANRVTRAPEWMRKASLEWLYRLLKEPRRLWKRYLVTNSLFVYHLVRDAITLRL